MPPPVEQIYIFTLAALALAILGESFMPRRALTQGLAWRWSNNFSLSLLTWYCSTVAGTWFMFWLASWTQVHQFGLLPRMGAGPVYAFFALLFVSQLLSYLVHVAFHRIPWLWPIHAVHHSDVDVDVSTSYRHHPLEPLLMIPVVSPVIVALGTSWEVVFAYKLFAIAITIFSHANVRLPRVVDKYARLFILTPDFHRLHHCAEPEYTNSNYGSVVPWFDYLFGTATNRPYEEQESMDLGLEYLRAPADGRLDKLLLSPVAIQRELGRVETS
jgi:sterol desaturase/sphingolipid hydroxylase (fatty acid hydroxylase superfamily)